ncbi:Crp/Fnr family transcriptional regulator [Pseudorhodoferax sp. Leaf274]|uniref:Crp/Fnr family transcriptional regulator n=1 Tax=Pseudorhodoferax sp. Leaf274 TaxID=1736318 RepID=UPI000ACE4B20|nr:Crp/Fnr family transcriptional regulator [Pseudorhodoferax sp. Leaf274]
MLSSSQPSAYASWDAARALSAPWLHNTAIGTVQRLASGEVLYAQGDLHDCFYLVRAGFVHTTVLRSDGSHLLLEIFGPGAIFGEASAFIDKPRYVTATAVTDAVLTRYRASEIQQLLSGHPELLVSLLQLLGIKHRILIDKLASFTSASPQSRLVDLFARAAIGQRHQDAPQLRLTHAQIGAMTGLSRVTVTRALKPLAARGWVATRAKGVEITDPEAFIALFEAR